MRLGPPPSLLASKVRVLEPWNQYRPPLDKGGTSGGFWPMPHIYTRNSEKRLRQSLRAEMPNAESVLWSKLRKRQILGYKFRRQYSVGTYVVDFYCAELRLAIEVDGDSHYRGGARARDSEREAFIKSFGIDFLRVRNVEVFEQLSDVLNAIARKVLEQRKPPCSPPLSKGDALKGRFSRGVVLRGSQGSKSAGQWGLE